MPARGYLGLSVAIMKDGAIVLDKGYGQSHLAPDVPMQADTPFLIGSITKQFVAAIVLLLADESGPLRARRCRDGVRCSRSHRADPGEKRFVVDAAD